MLITPEDQARIELLSMSRKDDQQVLWLCDMVGKLARLKPTEADFPARAALIDRNKCVAFALQFDGRVPVEQTVTLVGPPGQKVLLLGHTVKCDIPEAMFLVRPYVKLVSPRSEELLERLGRTGRVWMKAGKVQVVEDGSLDDILVGLDGYGVRRKPFVLRSTSIDAYGVGTLDEDYKTLPAETGIFVIDQDPITLELGSAFLEILENEEVTLAAGLVMGRYTSKGMPNPYCEVNLGRNAYEKA